jgi:hypothetical protein
MQWHGHARRCSALAHGLAWPGMASAGDSGSASSRILIPPGRSTTGGILICLRSLPLSIICSNTTFIRISPLLAYIATIVRGNVSNSLLQAPSRHGGLNVDQVLTPQVSEYRYPLLF